MDLVRSIGIGGCPYSKRVQRESHRCVPSWLDLRGIRDSEIILEMHPRGWKCLAFAYFEARASHLPQFFLVCTSWVPEVCEDGLVLKAHLIQASGVVVGSEPPPVSIAAPPPSPWCLPMLGYRCHCGQQGYLLCPWGQPLWGWSKAELVCPL